MEKILKSPTYSIQEVYELARKYKDLLPYKDRHKLILKELNMRGIPATAQDVRHAISGYKMDMNILLVIIDLGRKEDEKIGKVLSKVA